MSLTLPVLTNVAPVQADEQDTINVPASYTYKNVHRVKNRMNDGTHYKNRLQKTIVYDSREIMTSNKFYDNNSNDSQMVNLRHLTYSQYQELNAYALTLENSVRSQMHLRPDTTNPAIQRLAIYDGDFYVRDNKGDDNTPGHDTKAINDAARLNGVKPHHGWNYYEDYTGFFGFNAERSNPTTMSMSAVKHEIYQAMKEFFASMVLSKGVNSWSELDNELNDLSTYREWSHARDLATHYSKQFAISFSSRDGQEVSFHIMSIYKSDIKSAHLYYRR